MTNDNKIRSTYRCSSGLLHRTAQLLQGALQDATMGPPVVARLPATFVADFQAQIALMATHCTDQSSATGTLNAATHSQGEALAELIRHAALARSSATLAFPHQDELLRSEFQVGLHDPADLPSILDRSRKLLAACRRYPDELTAQGWTVADSTDLSARIDALAGADHVQEAASDTKLGATALRNDTGNALYKQCRLVQNAARIVYTPALAAGDPAAVAARARFLLDVFPPRSTAAANSNPAPATSPATPPAAQPLAA